MYQNVKRTCRAIVFSSLFFWRPRLRYEPNFMVTHKRICFGFAFFSKPLYPVVLTFRFNPDCWISPANNNYFFPRITTGQEY